MPLRYPARLQAWSSILGARKPYPFSDGNVVNGNLLKRDLRRMAFEVFAVRLVLVDRKGLLLADLAHFKHGLLEAVDGRIHAVWNFMGLSAWRTEYGTVLELARIGKRYRRSDFMLCPCFKASAPQGAPAGLSLRRRESSSENIRSSAAP